MEFHRTETTGSRYLSFFFFWFQLVNGLDRPRYICETEVMEEVNVASATPVEYTPPGNHTNKNANGNIITLTLKNNHLIVETEERAVSILEIINDRIANIMSECCVLSYFGEYWSIRGILSTLMLHRSKLFRGWSTGAGGIPFCWRIKDFFRWSNYTQFIDNWKVASLAIRTAE